MTSIRDSEVPLLKVGEVFYECEAGFNIEARVTEAPVEDGVHDGLRSWVWKAVNTKNGEVIDYRLTERLSHYGPRLYRDPQYASVKDGVVTIKFVGESDVAVED